MKNLLKTLRMAVLSAVALAAAPTAHAQVNITLGPPSWGPALPQGQQYYYIPETQGFYDVPARQYVVQRDGQWIRTATLSGYNPATFHPVVVDYVGAQPWSRYDEYRARYPRGGNPSTGALPPGQAKKMNGRGYGVPGDYRRDDDDRNKRGRDDHDRDDDHGKGRGHDKD